MSELARILKRSEATDAAVETLVASVQHLAATTTDAMELYAGRAVNNVLSVQTATFPASGALSDSYGTPCGSLLVINRSNDAVTVVAGLGSGSAPTQGQGVTIVPALTFLPVAIASNGWTMYGTAGDIISWTAFTGLHAFGIVR